MDITLPQNIVVTSEGFQMKCPECGKLHSYDPAVKFEFCSWTCYDKHRLTEVVRKWSPPPEARKEPAENLRLQLQSLFPFVEPVAPPASVQVQSTTVAFRVDDRVARCTKHGKVFYSSKVSYCSQCGMKAQRKSYLRLDDIAGLVAVASLLFSVLIHAMAFIVITLIVINIVSTVFLAADLYVLNQRKANQ